MEITGNEHADKAARHVIVVTPTYIKIARSYERKSIHKNIIKQ